MNLLRSYLDECAKGMDQNNISFRFVGNISMLDDSLQQRIYNIEKMTRDNRMILNIAINYGGRNEILHSVKKIAAQVEAGELKAKDIDLKNIEDNLFTAGLPDPDLIIRPSGEYRLSNFLIWQAAYSEFWFSDILWPDFTEDDLDKAIIDYCKRNRRFGGV
jgi:undecaprenyl diphosphate synthase